MSETMRERVRLAIADAAHTPITVGQSADYADAAITAVIEALAAEADDPQVRMDKHLGWTTADWLRAHLDAGRDGEAGR